MQWRNGPIGVSGPFICPSGGEVIYLDLVYRVRTFVYGVILWANDTSVVGQLIVCPPRLQFDFPHCA